MRYRRDLHSGLLGHSGREYMNPLRTCFVLLALILGFAETGPRAQAQNEKPAGEGAQAASATAGKAEVEELRKELAAQRRTIERLQTLVEQLAEIKSRATAPATDGAHLVNAGFVQPETASESVQATKTDQKPAEKKEGPPPLAAGWNGEHFFIKSSDGQFQLQPYGYFQTDYRAYRGDGAPSDTFVIRRARLGFLGSYGKYYDFALLADVAAGNGLSLRDLFMNVKPTPYLQVQVGQFKLPFAQEVLQAVTNIDFVERSLASLLYPSAATAFRSPGAMIRGDISGGVMQYWVGAFNGKGILTNNTTNEPEVIGRLRFYPWKKKKDSLFQGFAFGGSIGRGRSRGLSGEQSFSATIPDAAYNFFPSFRINGSIERYNGEVTWVHGPWGVRAEYDQLNQFRRGVGSEQGNALGFTDLPGIIAKAGYVQATYLLTGEARPENGTPKVKHPFLGPEGATGGHGWGAWEVAFRYDRIQAKEPGIDQPNQFTPGFVPTFNDHTDQFTGGLNWYLNYWIKYQVNVSVDRLKEPSTTGQEPQNFYVLLNRLQFRF